MTTINSVSALNAANLQQVKINNTQANTNQNLSQMKEMPSVSLGRDLVHPVETIKAGDKVLETAFQAATKPGQATFTLAQGNEVFPNVWDSAGGNYTPKKGDIILGYGEVPKDWGISNPNVLAEMDKKGLLTYPDRAVSAEPKLMYETYVGTDGRDFVKSPLKAGETVAAEKKIFPTKFLFAKPGTLVETLEAKEGSGTMAKVGDFQYVQVDAKGNPYVKDIKDLVKRLNPSNEESKGVFATIKETIAERAKIGSGDKQALSKLWAETLPKLLKK